MKLTLNSESSCFKNLTFYQAGTVKYHAKLISSGRFIIWLKNSQPTAVDHSEEES